MLEHIVAFLSLCYTMRPLGLEYFHNEVVISVNVRMSRAVLVAGHGEAVAEADTPRGHGVSHAC